MHNVLRGSPKPQGSWPPAPPPDENEESRQRRLEEEAQAKKRSKAIDKEIALSKKNGPDVQVKMLLLGQSESGKSTILKNFQAQFAPKAFASELELWKPVIHLNLIRSANFLVNFLNSRLAGMKESMKDTDEPHGIQLSSDVRRALVALEPLRAIEETLSRAIIGTPPSSGTSTPLNMSGSNRYYNTPESYGSRPAVHWKERVTGLGSIESSSTYQNPELAQVQSVLEAAANDIEVLWSSKTVRKALAQAEISLEEQPGFFLKDVARIAKADYQPTCDDILRSRMPTAGPEEHVIYDEEEKSGKKTEWVIYDVGGSKSQRTTWAQFFDDVHVIIFMAPISAFNQVIAEDDPTNRLTDTVTLWTKICQNKLLRKVEFVLFLNKLDILKGKIKAGIQFSEYVPSYGQTGGPNEAKEIAKYMMGKFRAINTSLSPNPKRKMYVHLTCAVDMAATASVIEKVRHAIMLNFLHETDMV